MRYNDLTDLDKIRSELVQDVDPGFDHAFCWNIGHKFLNEAKELFNQKGGN